MRIVFSDLSYERLVTKMQCETFFFGTSCIYFKSLSSKTADLCMKFKCNQIENNMPEMKQKEVQVKSHIFSTREK